MTAEDYLAELATLTSLSPQEWADFLSCLPEEQALIARGYRDQDWAQRPDTLARVLQILGVIGSIAGVVSGVAGAASAVAALKAAL